MREIIAQEIRKLSPSDRDILADIIGLSVYALAGIGFVVFSGYGIYRFLQFWGVL